MRRSRLAVAGAAVIGLGLALGHGSMAQSEAPLASPHWSFQGPFGTYDREQLQRGFQVFKEVCSNCHAVQHLYYRDLGPDGPDGGIGFTADEVKALAAQAQVTDGPNDQGEMYQRPARPSDRIVPPFPNEQAARVANNGALPPDLSLIVKARAGGPDYIYSILTGFGNPPAGMTMSPGMNYNEAFPGHQIAMPQPLSDGSVTYADGTSDKLNQEASDVVAFLNWASDPYLDARHHMGVKVLLYLLIATGVFFLAKRRIWAKLH